LGTLPPTGAIGNIYVYFIEMMTERLHKVVLAGGSGYLGHTLANYFKPFADEIYILTRGIPTKKQLLHVNYIIWDGKQLGDWQHILEGCDLLINLTGKSVNCRYTNDNKKRILDSRLNAVTVLGDAILRCKVPPKHFIQITSATIYRHSEDKPMTEAQGEIGNGFSEDVCQQWEACFHQLKLPSTTLTSILRTAIVYGKKDGVFTRLRNLVVAGMGGKQGKGNQMISWIHERDFCRLIDWMYHDRITGIINATSPQPVRNDEHMKLLSKAMHIPIALPQPEFLVGLGTFIIGTEAELILKSRYVLPEKALALGFQFEFPTIQKAFENLVEDE
jgi:uncharacterized protein